MFSFHQEYLLGYPYLTLMPYVLLNPPGFVHALIGIRYHVEMVYHHIGLREEPIGRLPEGLLHVYADFLDLMGRDLG